MHFSEILPFVPSILVIEDREQVLEPLRTLLPFMGAQILAEVKTLQEGIEFFKTSPAIDFALVDIRLKDADEGGFQLAKALNARNVPFVFITSFVESPRILQKALLLHPAGILIKPLGKETLFLTIISILTNPKFYRF